MAKMKWFLPLALTLAACQMDSPDQPRLSQPVQQPASPQSDYDPQYAYRSLIIGPEQTRVNDFRLQNAGSAVARQAVVVTLNGKDYVLTYAFMNKLRGLITFNPYRTTSSNGNPFAAGGSFAGIVTPGFFTRLKASATTYIPAAGGEPDWYTAQGSPSNPFAATLSSSEMEFVNLLEAQNGIEMPNYIQYSDTQYEATPSSRDALMNNINVFYDYGAQGGQNTIVMFNPKTLRKAFFVKLGNYLRKNWNAASASSFNQNDDYLKFYLGNYQGSFPYATPVTGTYYSAPGATSNSLGGTNNSIKNNILLNSTHNYNETTPPTGSLYRMNVNTVSNGTTPSLADALTLPEKSMLTSILNQAPVARDIFLLKDTGGGSFNVVKGNIGIGFNTNDLILPPAGPLDLNDFLQNGVSHYGVANVNSVFPYAAYKLPANNANLNGAAAVLLAGTITNRNQTQGLISSLGPINYGAHNLDVRAGTSGGQLGDLLRSIRALHMFAGGASAMTLPANELKFPLAGVSTFPTPVAAAIPNIEQVPYGSIEISAPGFNIFDALIPVFNNEVFKLGKTTGSYKNLEAIKRFFHANNPTNTAYLYRSTTIEAVEDIQIQKRALIVPCGRTINATTGMPSYNFAPGGSNFVIITAKASGSGNESLSFTLTDPNFSPGEGYPALNISSDNPALVLELYNYTGTLVGAGGLGF
ncbi:MAG: hypothetical protein ACAI44_20100 [Candidatus Sericytochromatia bacterium]